MKDLILYWLTDGQIKVDRKYKPSLMLYIACIIFGIGVGIIIGTQI